MPMPMYMNKPMPMPTHMRMPMAFFSGKYSSQKNLTFFLKII